MNRVALSCVMVTALIAVACGASDGVSQSPTAPTPSAPPPATPPAPTPPASCAPPPPTNLAVSVTGDSTRLFTWNASPTAADYFIGIGRTPGNSDLIYTNTTQTTYTWTGLSGTGGYYARVYARNSCGSSNWSTEIAFQ